MSAKFAKKSVVSNDPDVQAAHEAKGGKKVVVDLKKKSAKIEKTAKADKAPREDIADKKIKILVSKPEFDKERHTEAFALMKEHKTVEAYLEAGGKRKYLTRWQKEEIIDLV